MGMVGKEGYFIEYKFRHLTIFKLIFGNIHDILLKNNKKGEMVMNVNCRKNKFDEIQKQMGLRIKAHREAQHMSQSDLSIRSGISNVYISQIENGKKSNLRSVTMHLLAEALNVDIA